jgi:hypothetical protein
VEQFVNDQTSYCQRKNDKVEEMRIILENSRQKENIFRPNALLQRERKEHQSSTEVYERLYQDSKHKEQQSQQMSRQESNETLRNTSITSSKRFRGVARGNLQGKQSAQKLLVTSRELRRGSVNNEHENPSAELSAITTRKVSAQLGAATSR